LKISNKKTLKEQEITDLLFFDNLKGWFIEQPIQLHNLFSC